MNSKTLAGFPSPGFWVAVPTQQCVPYLLRHTVKYLSKAGITLLLEVFLGEGRVLKCFSAQIWVAKMAFADWREQQLSLGTCSLALGQGASSAKPGLAGGSQPSLG